MAACNVYDWPHWAISSRFSLVYIDVEAKVGFILDVRLMEGHLEVIVDEVDNEVGEPWLFAFSLEEAAEETETLLAEMVAEDLEGHQILILSKTLGEESKAEILNVIVGHVKVDERAVDCQCLSNSLCTVVSALIVGQL